MSARAVIATWLMENDDADIFTAGEQIIKSLRDCGFAIVPVELTDNMRAAMDHHEAAVAICKILFGLASPRDAARAIAIVRSNLFVAGGAKSADDVQTMMAEDDEVALLIWRAVHDQKN